MPVTERRLAEPAARAPAYPSALWLLPVALLALPLGTNDYTQYIVNLTLVYVLVGVGFNVVVGNLGQLAFANAAFYGIGAYTAAILLYHYKMPLLLAIAGILIVPITLLYPDLAAATLIRGFAAMTLGGFGSFHGAAIGGILLGIGELFVGAYLSSRLIEITAYLIIILVLLIRPSGLFGKKIVVRV